MAPKPIIKIPPKSMKGSAGNQPFRSTACVRLAIQETPCLRIRPFPSAGKVRTFFAHYILFSPRLQGGKQRAKKAGRRSDPLTL